MQQRQCIIVEGDAGGCQNTSKILLENFDKRTIISLSSHDDDAFLTIPQKQAQQYLGKEFDAVIFDALTEFNPDSLAAIIGTIRQGGVLIIWLNNNQNSRWLQRFNRIINQWSQTPLIMQKSMDSDAIDCPKSIESNAIDSFELTGNQQQAVEAIKKVVYGHRRRPLVLSADRGRGKSAALGIAAAQLLTEGKHTILVTAPSLTIADTVFEHARRLLTDAHSATGLIALDNAEIRFIAPDALIKLDIKADLVLVDEAAAIPVSILQKILQKYSRLVFATTLHGYEGTGRGFAVRFQKILDQQTPDWHHYQMTTPIRWGENDLLEQFSFQSLLLDALPVADALIMDSQIEQCQIEIVDRKQLLAKEQDLRELFGLMVLAHYRTRPSDLQMMLDCDDITVYVVRYQGHIVASTWLLNEGELDHALSHAVYQGIRRLKGHLLPQSLLAHAGAAGAGTLKYQRIVRIAVHPAIQHRNIGQTLLRYCIKHSQTNGGDIIGASFAMDEGLISFWSKSAFEFVRLGIHCDDVSGSHSVMMLQAISETGKNIVNVAKSRFQQHWLHLLGSQFKQLQADQVITLSQLLVPQYLPLSLDDKREIEAFAYSRRSYEFCQVALWSWVGQQVSSPAFLQLSQKQQSLCVQSILQQRSWAEIAKDLAFSGKKQAVEALRELVAILYS